MTIGSGLAHLEGYPFEVRYSDHCLSRVRVAADIAAEAYGYLSGLFSDLEPDIAVIVASQNDWERGQPYGLPFFNDDDGQIRPGIVVMPAESGEFWIAIGQDLREASPHDYPQLLEAYPDGAGGLDLQPFFDLVTIHELGHAFEVFGDLKFPTFWLSEGPARRTRSLANLRVPMHVVPSIGVKQRALAGPFKYEARIGGNSTRSDVLNGVTELQAMESQIVEQPVAQ